MLAVRNKAAITTPVSLAVGTTVVPFDTLVCSTNGNIKWTQSNNSVSMTAAGRYNTNCTAVISCIAGGTATLQLLANGTALSGDYVSATIEANGTVPLVLSVPVNVQQSAGDDSYLQWSITVSAASTLDNAYANIQGIR